MFAEIYENLITKIVSCTDCPPGFVEYPDTAEIHVGSDIRFYSATGEVLSEAHVIKKGLIAPGPNQRVIWDGGRYLVESDYTGQDYWDKSTGQAVAFELGDQPDGTMTNQKPPHIEAEWKRDKWVVPAKAKAADARSKRDELLGRCDFIMLADHPSTNKAAWKTYRQDLRDVPAQAGFPDAITWPTKPDDPKL